MASRSSIQRLHGGGGLHGGGAGSTATAAPAARPEQPKSYEDRMRHYEGVFSGAIIDTRERRTRGRFAFMESQPSAMQPAPITGSIGTLGGVVDRHDRRPAAVESWGQLLREVRPVLAPRSRKEISSFVRRFGPAGG